MSKKRSTTDRSGLKPAAVAPQWDERRTVPTKLSTLRQKLYLKAKREPRFRFYALYDRIYRKDVLWAAWKQVRRNKGACGIDGVTIDQIVNEENGPEQLVAELHDELRAKAYRPQPVKRVYIPKPSGAQRPLGIPTVRDRVAQTAAVLILEPIFEADFCDCSYAFRPKRSAHQAIEQVRKYISSGYREIYDVDLSSYFDTIPHDKLMAALRVRITDRSTLHLIGLWLKSPVVDEEQSGPSRRNRRGTPQGGVISPLLANIYLHWFDHAFHGISGPAQFASARLVRYADDLVVLTRGQGGRVRRWVRNTLVGRLDLRLNSTKTKIVDLARKGESLNYLGFTFRYDLDRFGRGNRYLNVFPSKEATRRECQRLTELTNSRWCFLPIPALIRRLNRQIEGWANYFGYGYPRDSFRRVNTHVRNRLTRHLWRRSQRRYRPPKNVSFYQHLTDLGLVYL